MENTQSNFIYLHGLPGSAEEVSAFNNAQILYMSPYDLKGFEDQFNRTKRYTIIGFSLGCMTAIEIASKYSNNIDALILISPAAPLELGDFLDAMDGRFVFRGAQKNSVILSLLTLSQTVMAHVSPNFLMRKMFGESCDAEHELLKNQKFVTIFQNGLRLSLGRERKQYEKTIKRYINPWAEIVGKVTCPVQIWHGTEDTWAPHAMGVALKQKFQTDCKLISCAQLGHYSTLHHAIKHIFKNHPVGN